MSVVAIVPMRHHSMRVPEKNYRPFVGRPLYHCVIESLLACPRIQAIVIDTDSPTIFEDATKHFPSVQLIERPQSLRADTTPMNDVLLNTVTHFSAQFFLQTHSTNPLLRPETIGNAIDKFFEAYPDSDSLFSVTRRQIRLWDQDGKPINHDPAILLRTQDLPPVYEENSCIYIFTREGLEARRNRLGERPLMFEIDAQESIDIDELFDFYMAEYMYQKLHGDET